ncbi:hypothetical protein [Nocardioides pyridinolyticus]
MKKHHVIALGLASTMAALIAVDTLVRAATGHASLITDDARGSAAAGIGMSVLLGLTLAACATVLQRESAAFAGTRTVVRAARRAAIAGLAVSAVGQIVVHPVEVAVGVDAEGPWAAATGVVALLALLVVFLSALVLGVASTRHNHLGVGGRVLSLLLPAIALTAVLVAVTPALASPVLCTAVVLLGCATVGLRATTSPTRIASDAHASA